MVAPLKRLAIYHLAIPLFFAGTGCSRTALVTRSDGTLVSGRILSSSSDSLVLRTSQQDVEVGWSEVERLQHPGGAATVVGGVGLGVGLTATLGGIVGLAITEPCEGDGLSCFLDGRDLALGALLWGLAVDLVGAILLGHGRSIRSASEDAADPTAPPPAWTRPSSSGSPPSPPGLRPSRAGR